MPEQPSTKQPLFSLANIFKLFGIAIKLVIVVMIVVLVGSIVFKDFIIRIAGAQVASSALGAPVHMGYFSWSFMRQKIDIRDLVISQPSGFEEGGFMEVPQITIEYDLGDLLKGNLRMPLVVVDLRQMTVIKSAEGPLNVDAIKALHTDKKDQYQIPMFQIDQLKLNVGRVIYKDQFRKKKPIILVYDINLKNKTFKNINNAPKLITVVMWQALKPTAIHSAGVAAAVTVMGVGFLPGTVIGIVVAKDASVGEFAVSAGKSFEAALRFVKEHGRLISSDKDKGIIEAKVQGVDIRIRVEKVSWFRSRMTVSGRKFMLPKKEFAGGILYQIGELLQNNPRN